MLVNTTTTWTLTSSVLALFLWVAAAESAEKTPQSFGLKTVEIPSSIHTEEITAATLSGKGLLALGTAKGHVLILDKDFRPWRDGMEVSVGTSEISDLTFSSNGTTVAGVMNKFPFVWHLGDQKPIYIPVSVDFPKVALSADGHLLALANFNVAVIDLKRRTIIKLERKMEAGGLSQYDAVAFTSGSALVIGAAAEGIDAWNIESGKNVQHWSCGCDSNGISISRTGGLAAVGTKGAHVLLWDLATAKLLEEKTISLEVGDHVYGTTVDLTGTLVAAGSASGSVAVWDTRSGAIVGRSQISPRPIVRLESSDDGQLILVYGQKEPYVRGRYDYWLVSLAGR